MFGQKVNLTLSAFPFHHCYYKHPLSRRVSAVSDIVQLFRETPTKYSSMKENTNRVHKTKRIFTFSCTSDDQFWYDPTSSLISYNTSHVPFFLKFFFLFAFFFFYISWNSKLISEIALRHIISLLVICYTQILFSRSNFSAS